MERHSGTTNYENSACQDIAVSSVFVKWDNVLISPHPLPNRIYRISHELGHTTDPTMNRDDTYYMPCFV